MASKPSIQVIGRAAAVLRALEGNTTGLCLPDIARLCDLPQSTVQRIVKALEEEGMVESAGSRSGFRIGPLITRMGAAVEIDVVGLVKPYLRELSSKLQETVDLSTLRDGRALFLDQIIGKARLSAVSAAGDSFPLHCTANGKALLASLSRTRRTQILAENLERHTDKTIVDHDELEAEIRLAQVSQIAFDREEHTDGICAVATAFSDGLGRSFAISVPIPTPRFTKRERMAADLLLTTRRDIVASISNASLI